MNAEQISVLRSSKVSADVQWGQCWGPVRSVLMSSKVSPVWPKLRSFWCCLGQNACGHFSFGSHESLHGIWVVGRQQHLSICGARLAAGARARYNTNSRTLTLNSHPFVAVRLLPELPSHRYLTQITSCDKSFREYLLRIYIKVDTVFRLCVRLIPINLGEISHDLNSKYGKPLIKINRRTYWFQSSIPLCD